MRVLFSLVALLIVAYTVMQLAKTQLAVLAPVAGSAQPAASQATPRPSAQQLADEMRRAMDAGATARASEPQR